MPVVIDLVDHTLLLREPPRILPPLFIPNLLGEYLLERPLRSYFDPLLIGGLVAALSMVLLEIGLWLWLILLMILVTRLVMIVIRIWQCVKEDWALLKYGVVCHAHIIRVRNSRDHDGNINGAYLDCAIPIRSQCTSVGSVWMSDATKAMRVARDGRVPVICLTRGSGTWRLLEDCPPILPYEPVSHP